MACGLYLIQNTGATTSIASFTSCETSETCVENLTIASGDSYYINAKITSGAPVSGTNISYTYISVADTVYNFSSVCDTSKFFIYGKSGGIVFNSGDTYCFEEIISCASNTELFGCYTFYDIGTDLGNTQFSSVKSPSYSGASVTACTAVCSCCGNEICVSGTDEAYDDNYKFTGTYNGYDYFSGQTNGYVIYYSTGDTSWCLSTTLGGACLQSGKSPCISTCPDLCDEYLLEGVCPTPTPSPTTNCNVLDFTAIFDCEVTPTPSITPTISVTPTISLTPSPTSYCSIIGVDATITGYTPTPTPTRTPTPTPTPDVTRPCNVIGNVSFVITDGNIKCPSSSQFQDCLNGQMYYTINTIVTPSGDTIAQYMIFKANVDGVSRCLSYVGTNNEWIGTSNIELIEGPIGYSNLGDCVLCTPDVTQTPTPTPTPTKTPTPTPTPTPSPSPGYYVYQECDSGKYVIQTLLAVNTIVGAVFFNKDDEKCWEYIGYYPNYPQLPLPLPPGSIANYTGNYFPNIGARIFDLCRDCKASKDA
jgi:hypothetical protein